MTGDGAREEHGAAAEHVPVLYAEVLDALQPRPGGCYIDATVGLGGHAAGLLARSAPDGRLLGIDADPEALVRARAALTAFGERAVLVQARNALLDTVAGAQGFAPADGILFDLGVSSLQLDDAARGFSFRADGPLDMRMGPDAPYSAQEIVNTWPEGELARVLFEYGEERQSRRIARAICLHRPLHSTLALAELIARVVGGHERIHPATRSFQALRIAVNGELDSLAAALPKALGLLVPGARLAVIAFHSLEDRIVKQFMQREARDCLCPPRMPRCVCGHVASVRLITRKPTRPGDDEVAANPRSRSARLRVAERLA